MRTDNTFFIIDPTDCMIQQPAVILQRRSYAVQWLHHNPGVGGGGGGTIVAAFKTANSNFGELEGKKQKAPAEKTTQ